MLKTFSIPHRNAAVFQKDVMSAIGGNSIITHGGADVLAQDMTALDASHVIIEGNYNWANDDILLIKEGLDEEWMVITDDSGDPQFYQQQPGSHAKRRRTHD